MLQKEEKFNMLKAIIFMAHPMLKTIFNIIRWPNLLMLGGIQLLVFYRLMQPLSSVLTWIDLTFLVVITILLGAAGYVINDYYDADIDKINKPAKWIAGNKWSLAMVRTLYLMISFTGFLLSIWLALRLGLIKYIFIYPIAATGLWFYSYSLKCKPMIGNMWVSFFCAGVVCIVALPDILLDNSRAVKIELWYYAGFAFIATLYREVVKDIEDIEGDAQVNCQTAVVRFGLNFGKWIAIVLGLLLIVSLLFWERQQTDYWIKLILTILEGFTIGSMAF
ncbi:MAG TPA: UbiA family prenyltransferase, partial [Saprospiraceae bacterium]|nr:UbiA family prenyltransferase [Saprospiraceae bacterium]